MVHGRDHGTYHRQPAAGFYGINSPLSTSSACPAVAPPGFPLCCSCPAGHFFSPDFTLHTENPPGIAQKPPQRAPHASIGTTYRKQWPGRFTGTSARFTSNIIFRAPRVKREKAFYPQPARKRAARHHPWHFLCPGQQSNEEPPGTGIFYPRPEGGRNTAQTDHRKPDPKRNARPAKKAALFPTIPKFPLISPRSFSYRSSL